MTIRRSGLILVAALALSSSGLAAELAKVEPAASPLSSDGLTAFTALGYAAGQNLHVADLHWTEAQFEAFVAGQRACFRGARFTMDEKSRPQLDAITRSIQEVQKRGTQPQPQDAVRDALRDTARKFGLQQVDSGLLVRIIRGGSGPRPMPLDTVILSISARTLNGTVDIKQLAAEHARIKIKDLMPGLAQGVQMIALGGAALLVVPPELSFGDRDWPAGVTPGTPLTFMVELHDVIAADAAP